MSDDIDKSREIIGKTLPDLIQDKPLFDQQESLLKKGVCALDFIEILQGIEEAWLDGAVKFTQDVNEGYEVLTVLEIRDMWQPYLRWVDDMRGTGVDE